MIAYTVVHLLLGFIGAIIVAKLELRQGMDYTINDLVLSIVAMICGGPLLLAVGILYSFGEPSKVLIRGEKK